MVLMENMKWWGSRARSNGKGRKDSHTGGGGQEDRQVSRGESKKKARILKKVKKEGKPRFIKPGKGRKRGRYNGK